MKINVGVFFGGRSVEHEVAVISAVQAMNAMDTDKYNIVPVYIAKSGEMYHSELMKDIGSFRDIPALISQSAAVTMIKSGDRFSLIELKKGLFKKNICNIDIAFPIVHGTNCEDGSLVGWFELLGVPFVSCGVCSAAVGMEKDMFKYLLNEKGVPTLPCVTFYAKEWTADKDGIINEIEEKFGYPLIIKPANLGSSVGISKAHDRDELMTSVADAMQFAQKILVEPAVEHLREFNCSVVGDCDECAASVIEEPVMSGELLSYADKYQNGGKSSKSGGAKSGGTKGGAENQGMASVKRKIPADIPDSLKSDIRRYSKAAFTALGCNGVVRIDYLYDCDADKVYVNEINTIPGSLSFYLWEPAGVPYRELLSKMIDLGFKRARTKENLTFTYETNILSQCGSFGSKGKK